VPAFAPKAYDVHTYCARLLLIDGGHNYHVETIDFNVRQKFYAVHLLNKTVKALK